jgi:glycosyltransferase involved in cell wall biosynthesis
LGLHPGQPLVVKIANIESRKDHATLLHAWKIVQDDWSGTDPPILALAGNFGERYEECRRISREQGLDSTVHFLGSIHDVPALIHACDVAVFSSLWEGMPNGVLECMAGGKAIVATDIPGVRDALGPNADDFLVPLGDCDEFARKLLTLLRSRERQDVLGHANLARIRAEFSVARMAERQLKAVESGLRMARLTRARQNLSAQRTLPTEAKTRHKAGTHEPSSS